MMIRTPFVVSYLLWFKTCLYGCHAEATTVRRSNTTLPSLFLQQISDVSFL